MRSPRRVLAAVTALHAVVGAWIATSITGPMLAIDDLAYLSMGRTLAGGGSSPLPPQPPYGVLYPSLLSPGWLVGLDEPQMIVFAQVINALLGAALLPVLYVLVRRLTAATPWWALGAAAIGASLPAALLTGTIAWTERLIPLLIALALLALLRLEEMPSRSHVAEVALVAVGLVAAHPRTIVVAAVVVAAGLWILAGSGRRGELALFWVLSHAGLALTEVSRRALASATFGDESTYDGADLASRRGLDEATEMAVKAGGTLAYLVLATAGFAVLGMVLIARRPRAATYYGAMGVATVVVAGWFLTGVGRPDSYVHGRYIEVLAPLLVALGVIAARELRWQLSAILIAGTVVVAGLYGAWAGPGDNWARARTPTMMLGIDVSGAPFGATLFQIGAATSVALVVGLLVLAAARGRAWEPPFVVSLVVAMAVMSGTESLDALRDKNITGEVQTKLADVAIGELVVDADRISSTVVASVAWEVGLDVTSTEISIDMTHVLLPVDAVPPAGATLVAELGVVTNRDGTRQGGGVLWELR